MSMTREKAIAYFEARGNYNPHDGTNREAEKMALTALRGPTREMVERMRGEWRPTETPFMNECEDCSKCGYRTAYGHGFQFCPVCGAPMTDEAVDMMLERMRDIWTSE